MANKAKTWRERRRDLILAEARRTGCSYETAAERVMARQFSETATARTPITESAKAGKAAKKLRKAIKAASSSAESLAKMNRDEFDEASAAYWGNQLAEVDARQQTGRSPFWRGIGSA